MKHYTQDHGHARWTPLRDMLRTLSETTSWLPRDFELLFEIESILYLYEEFMPDDSKRLAKEAWALASGYIIEGLNDEPDRLRQCLLGRERLRYVKIASTWHWWLKWYSDLPKHIRLYDLFQHPNDKLGFRRRIYEIPFRENRIAAYQSLFADETLPTHHESRPQWANADTYRFFVDDVPFEVAISEAMAAYAHTPTPTRTLPKRTHQEAIKIDLDTLLQTAKELDELEISVGLEKTHNWYQRLNSLDLTLLKNGETHFKQRQFTIEGLFHLVGALGVGKSTLIWVLTYHLARYESCHITVMLHTVVEAIQMAAWLRKLGISAAPALGRNRADHEHKYGLANSRRLNNDRIFQSEPFIEPEYNWMPAPCALSGAGNNTIPVGKEPCRNLLDVDGNEHICPLIPVCPVHQLGRDLVESQVWIVNPMSILYSFAPAGIGSKPIRLLDAIYQVSDLLIVDEADRVQVQWDRSFTPTRILAGIEHAFLDRLHEQITSASIGTRGRRSSARAAFQRLIHIDNQAHTLSSSIFHLLRKWPALVKWIGNMQMTNYRLFTRLVAELVEMLPTELDLEQKNNFKKTLKEDFQRYWGKPLGRERGFLNEWVSDLLGGDVREKTLLKLLEKWLAERMKWTLPLGANQRFFVQKLQFCLIFAALLRRCNDLYYQLDWVQDELDWEQPGTFDLPDTLINLVPDPPLGNLLGVSLIHRQPGQSLGVFNAIRYQGVGRWLLMNFSNLYWDQSGKAGPNILLTSATSWFPGSTQFHLAATPDALLTSNMPMGQIDIQFNPVRNKHGRWIKVSGAMDHREHNLRQIIRKLATGNLHSPSDFQNELNFWQNLGLPRRILLVVQSYDQAEWVLEEFKRLPEWEGRVRRLIRDDAENENNNGLRAREAELFGIYEADILIAPLMAIQRGFNILDEAEGALLGTAYFLVRPFPPPEDLSPQILALNYWMLDQLQAHYRSLKAPFSEMGIEGVNEVRQRAYQRWYQRLGTKRASMGGMDDNTYNEFICDTFVTIWQTIGRLLRGGRDARVYFVDAAFASVQGQRHMLRDWQRVLDSLMNKGTPHEQYLASALYGAASESFRRASEQQRIF